MSADRPNRWDVPFDVNMSEEMVNRILLEEPFRSLDETRFPKALPLRGILKNDSRVLSYNRGDVVVREGDYGSSAFFILKGKVKVIIPSAEENHASVLGTANFEKKNSWQMFQQWLGIPDTIEYRASVRFQSGQAAVREVGGQTRLFLQDIDQVLSENRTAEIREGEFFGEMAALGRIPRSATVVCEDDGVELLEIKWQGLRELRQFGPKIKEHIDKIYRERSLKSHLRETKIFAHLSDDVLDEFAKKVKFQTFGKYDWNTTYNKVQQLAAETRLDDEPIIVEQGAYANYLVLIRSGFARLSERSGSGHRTIAYFGKGQYFGFREIAMNYKGGSSTNYEFTLRAIGHVDILLVPSEAVEKFVMSSLPKELQPYSIVEKKDASASLDERIQKLSSREEKVGVSTEVLEFLVENRFINGTATMMIDLNRCTRCDDCVRACASTHGNNPRFIRQGKRQDHLMIAHACMHCQDPVCMIGCPTGAINRNASTGNIVIQDIVCIGCGACSESCPYGNIQMVEARNEDNAFILDTKTGRPILKATKCDLCFDQDAGPACERACPHDALVRIDMRDRPGLAKWVKR